MQPDPALILAGLAYAFEPDISLDTPSRGTVTLCHHHVGDLIVTSGSLVACDPQWADEETTQAFTTVIPLGRYPVVLSVEHALRRYQTGYRDYQTVAFATLRLHERRPVRWSIATTEGGTATGLDEAGEIPSYSVDAGAGCFMDADAAQVLVQRLSTTPEYGDVLLREMEAAYVGPWDTGGWATMSMQPETPANLIACSSGAGDGVYATYSGYDADNILVCVTTDFALFWPET